MTLSPSKKRFNKNTCHYRLINSNYFSQHGGTNFTAFRLIDTNKDEVKSVIADIVAKEIIQGRQLDIEVLLSYFLSDLFFTHKSNIF